MTDEAGLSVDRRAVLEAVIALCTAAATASALPAKAAAFVVPLVDALTLTVVTDSGTFGPFLPDLDLPGLKVRRSGGGPPADGRMST